MSLPMLLALLGCPPSGDTSIPPPLAQTDTTMSMDCIQGFRGRDELVFIRSDTDPMMWAVGDQLTIDGSLSWTTLEGVEPDYGQRPEAVYLPDGTLYWPRRSAGLNEWALARGAGEVAYWLDPDLVLARTDDGGATWTRIEPAVPVEPQHAHLYETAIQAWGDTIVLWQSGVADALYVSDDGGLKWRNAHLSTDEGPLTLTAAAAGPDGRIVVAIDSVHGPFLQASSDGGFTWERLPDIDYGFDPTGLGNVGDLVVTDDGALWFSRGLSAEGRSEVVFHRSRDWTSWELITVEAPDYQRHAGAFPELTQPPAAGFSMQPLPGGRLGWIGSISDGGMANWFDVERPYEGSPFCVIGDDTVGEVTPDFPLSPVSSLSPGDFVPVRRYKADGIRLAQPHQAFFAGGISLSTDGGQRWSASTQYRVIDAVVPNSAAHVFVLLEPDDLGTDGAGHHVPEIRKIDLTTGDTLDTRLVGPFSNYTGGEAWVDAAFELAPVPGEDFPIYRTSRGWFRTSGSGANVLAARLSETALPFAVDADGQVWTGGYGWLQRSPALENWVLECDRVNESSGCLRQPDHGLNRVLVVDDWLYVGTGHDISRRKKDGSTDWELVFHDLNGFDGAQFYERSDGLYDIWFVSGANPTLVGAVPEPGAPLTFVWPGGEP